MAQVFGFFYVALATTAKYWFPPLVLLGLFEVGYYILNFMWLPWDVAVVVYLVGLIVGYPLVKIRERRKRKA